MISYSTHACLDQLDRHQTCKPVVVSVVSSSPTGGNFIFLRHLNANFVQKCQKCQICVIYENLECKMMHTQLLHKSSCDNKKLAGFLLTNVLIITEYKFDKKDLSHGRPYVYVIVFIQWYNSLLILLLTSSISVECKPPRLQRVQTT